jgi:hypothetical protein
MLCRTYLSIRMNRFIQFAWFIRQKCILHFYCHITSSLKVSDGDTVEFVKPIEFPWNSPDLDPLGYHVEAILNHEWPNQRELFQSLELLQQRIVNMFMWPLVLQNNTQSMEKMYWSCSPGKWRGGSYYSASFFMKNVIGL